MVSVLTTREFTRRGGSSLETLTAGAERVAASVAGQDARYTTHVQTWSRAASDGSKTRSRRPRDPAMSSHAGRNARLKGGWAER